MNLSPWRKKKVVYFCPKWHIGTYNKDHEKKQMENTG